MTTNHFYGKRPSIPTLLEKEFRNRKDHDNNKENDDMSGTTAVFLCGPKALTRNVKAFLPTLTDSSTTSIHEELFEY